MNNGDTRNGLNAPIRLSTGTMPGVFVSVVVSNELIGKVKRFMERFQRTNSVFIWVLNSLRLLKVLLRAVLSVYGICRVEFWNV